MSLDLKKLMRDMAATDKIVTPQLEEWLLTHDPHAYSQATVDRIAELLATPQRNRVGTFSPSSLGTCPRRQVLAFLGAPSHGAISNGLKMIFDDGAWRHLRWQALLLEAGIVDDVEVGLPWPKMNGMGSIDAAGHIPDTHPHVRWRGQEFGVELKGMNQYVFNKSKKDGAAKGGEGNHAEKHREQFTNYALFSGIRIWSYIIEDKNINEYAEFVYEVSDTDLAVAKEKLVSLNRSVDRKELPPILNTCKIHMGPDWDQCPFSGVDGTCLKAGKWPQGF